MSRDFRAFEERVESEEEIETQSDQRGREREGGGREERSRDKVRSNKI